MQDNQDDEKTQPEETFDEHVASLIRDFKDKLEDEANVIVIVKPSELKSPVVFYKGHPYDITKMGVDFVREMKELLGTQLEC